MQPLLEQEIEKVASLAKDRISSDDDAVCLIHHIKDKKVPLTKLVKTVQVCRPTQTVTKKTVRNDLETLALLGLIVMYLDETYDLSKIGKQVIKSLRKDPYEGRR